MFSLFILNNIWSPFKAFIEGCIKSSMIRLRRVEFFLVKDWRLETVWKFDLLFSLLIFSYLEIVSLAVVFSIDIVFLDAYFLSLIEW